MKITTTLFCALGLVGLTSLPCQAATVETPGYLKYECWFPPLRNDTLIGTDIYTLDFDPNYPNTPDMVSYAAGMDSRKVFPDDSHEQYGARLTGWLTPMVTGDYYFYLASDDSSQLYISDDATEANLIIRAEEIGCCKGFLEPGNPQTSAAMHLVAGQKYALKIMLKEGGGGDYVQVAMKDTNSTAAASSLKPLVSSMLSSMADPTGATLQITQQPVSTSTPENVPVTFTIAATATTPYGKYTGGGTPVLGGAAPLGTKAQIDTFYQWFVNGAPVDGANGTNYTIQWPKKALNGARVKCLVAVPGIPIYSSEAILTVTDDTVPPTVVSAKADLSFVSVVVKFSEPVPDSALLASHYTIDQGVTVSAGARVDLTTVKLTTTKMVDGKTYTLTINGVQDTATPANTIAANTTVQFKSFVFVPGVVLHQKYNNFSDSAGNDSANLFADSRFRDNADRRDLMAMFEYPANASGRDATADPTRNYFDTLEAWFVPPVNGNYVFFMAFADRCWVYLSTDESPANRVLLMSTQGWSDPRNWLTSHDYAPANARSDQSPNNQWVGAPNINLQAGKRYYLLAIHHDTSWAGGDWFGATYKQDTQADPANGTAPTLTGSAVGAYLDPTVGSVTFSLQPTNQNVYAGNKATFYSAASGTSSYSTTVRYQWQSAPKGSSVWTDISGATAATYTTPYLVGADDGKQFRVIAMVAPITATSSVATLSVAVDEVPPTVVKASTDMNWTNVMVTFSEPVTDTALLASRYQMDQGIGVTAATRVDQLTVRLTTSTLAPDKVYILTINGVQDLAGNTIAANTQVEVRTLMFLTGYALHKKYNSVDNGVGSNPENLFLDARYPGNPDRRDMMATWEYPANGNYRDIVADPLRNYFDTIEGYFIPPADGNYVFFICGADRFWLYLSEDENPANRHMIAAQPDGWTNPRDWMLGQNTDITPQRSDLSTLNTWPTAPTITLQKGKRYYMLEIHHDPSWCGADDFAATYKLEGEADPVNGDVPRLAGSVIGYYFDPSGANVTFTAQPQNVTAVEGRTATFTVAATGSSAYGSTVFYQWQSAPKGTSTWTDVAGATGPSYTTPLLGVASDGTQFRVIASVSPYSKTSATAVLTVLADTFPPAVTAGAMLDDVPGVVDVGVGFDETVDSTVGVQANYSVSPGTITGIAVYTNRFTANSQNPLVSILKQTVVLKVTGLTGSGTLTVRNVGDLKGNKIASVDVPFTVDTKMKWGVVGANEAGGWNAVAPVVANGYDIYSDGVGAWSTYDEATLVYEQVTGDFDKKLRVAYQDGSTTWARAGLIAKEATAFGVDRATQATTAVRYQKCLVYPVGATLSGPGTLGTASWDLNRRLDVGGLTSGAPMTGPNAVPAYPNAWCRLKRVDQTFTMYRSDDGVNWVQLGSTTWGVDDVAKSPMPLTLYVGPDYSPELGNITNPADWGTFLAQIRDYGDYSTVFNPQLNVGVDATGKVTITWSAGTLVASPTVGGTYAPVTGATSPYVVDTAAAATKFYRIRQ